MPHSALLLSNVRFNPRSHEGSDIIVISYCYSTTVSIHAPTRGATVTYYLLYLDEMRFNPRSHEGSDVTFRLLEIIISQFNPRSHEGSDIETISLFVNI